jgi:hypothetical protein
MRLQGIRVALVATTALTSAGTALSQEAEGGVQFLFGVSSSLRFSDNIDLDPVSAGTTIRSDTRLSFGVHSETRRQKLSLEFGGVLRAEDAPGSGTTTGFVEPRVDLSYSRDGANAGMSVDVSYSRSEIDSFDPFGDDTINNTDLITDTGTRDSFRVGAMFEFGRQAPLGFVLELDHLDTRYADTTDPGLFDRTTDSASATAVLRFSPVTEGRASVNVIRYEAEDATMTTRDTRALSFGLTHEASENTVISASLGARRIDDSVAGVTRGAEVSLSLTHAVSRGTVGFSVDHEQTSAGVINTIEAERRFELPTGALGISLGAVDGSGIDPQVIGSLSYRHDLPTGAFTASFSRSISVNDDAQTQRLTRAQLGLSRTMNNLSSISFGIDYADVSDAGGGAIVDRQRGSLRATYTRALTDDWNFSAGYERRYLAQAGASDAWDNAVFMTLNRSFTLRP